jgi:hypothetical protein
VHIELALDVMKLRDLLPANASSAATSSVALANDIFTRRLIESSLTKRIQSVWTAAPVASTSAPVDAKFGFKVVVTLRPKDTMMLPVFVSICGEIDRINTAVIELSRFVGSADKSDGESSSIASLANALSATTFHILSNPEDVATMKSSLATSSLFDKDISGTPSHLIDHLIDSDLSTSYYSMNSYLKYALLIGAICFFFSCLHSFSPLASLWNRFFGNGKESLTISSVGHSRGIRKNSKA